MKIRIYYSLWILIVFLCQCACTDFVQIDPPASQPPTNLVFTDEAAANSAIRGIYSDMINSSGFAGGGVSSVTLLSGRSADDFINYSSTGIAEFSTNSILQTNNFLSSGLWNEMYKYIYYSNSAIAGLTKSKALKDSITSQLIGEAKFIRAFSYFYLVNLFGPVPIVTSTDYKITKSAMKNSIDEIYNFIETDFLDAEARLNKEYEFSSGERSRPNRWAAKSMLARVYLYRGEWQKAKSLSNEVIENSSLFVLQSDLSQIFLKNSEEAIWQLIPPPNSNTKEGASFILTRAPSTLSISNELLGAFENGDMRKTNWIGSVTSAGKTYYYPFKYKVRSSTTVSEYSMVLRLAEQILIRAEAETHLNEISQAIADVDLLRARAQLPLITEISPNISAEDLRIIIMNERRVEFFAEWGHRWLDLKRTGLAGAILAPIKGDGWQETDELYPIPQTEINNNPSLLPQNPGY